MKMSSACSFIFMQIKVIFIRMVLHLDSLWNRFTRDLGNGLFPRQQRWKEYPREKNTKVPEVRENWLQMKLGGEFWACDVIKHTCKAYVKYHTMVQNFPCFPGACFSKAPETFWARKATAKSWTLQLQSCFIHRLLL